MTPNADELSRSLDELNAGRRPKAGGDENAKLLEVASLIKQSGLHAAPPPHILEAAVQSAAAGLSANRSKRRNAWMYSGVVGAAASLLLFLGLHGLPGQGTAPAAPPMPSQAEPAPVSDPQKSPPPGPPPVASPGVPSGTPSSTPAIASPANPAPTPGTASLPPAPTASAPAGKPAVPAENSAAAAAQPAALRLPGRSPDSTSFNPSAGTLKQVYGSGTSQEIIITQRVQPQASNAAPPESRVLALRSAGKSSPETSESINTVTVTIAGQEVTLEGRRTRQELLDLAATLMP